MVDLGISITMEILATGVSGLRIFTFNIASAHVNSLEAYMAMARTYCPVTTL